MGFNKICKKDMEKRRVTRRNWLNNMKNKNFLEKLKTYQKESSCILRREKRKYLQDIMENVELDYRVHKTRDIYKIINIFTDDIKRKKILEKRNETSIVSSEEIVILLAEHFIELLNCKELSEVFSFELQS